MSQGEARFPGQYPTGAQVGRYLYGIDPLFVHSVEGSTKLSSTSLNDRSLGGYPLYKR